MLSSFFLNCHFKAFFFFFVFLYSSNSSGSWSNTLLSFIFLNILSFFLSLTFASFQFSVFLFAHSTNQLISKSKSFHIYLFIINRKRIPWIIFRIISFLLFLILSFIKVLSSILHHYFLSFFISFFTTFFL